MKTFRDALQSQALTVTAELTLTPTMSATDIVGQAQRLAAVSHAIHVPDHRYATPHVSNLAAGAHLLQAGIDPVVHMNCRDRSRIALQSDLLSARSFGISNLLIMRGGKIPSDQPGQSTSIFDFGAIDMIKIAAAIRDGDVDTGAQDSAVRDFYIGAVGTVFNPDETWEPENLTLKADAGAQFVQLHACLKPTVLREYMSRLVAAKLIWRNQILVSIPVLASVEQARSLRKNIPEAIVPREIIQRLKQANDAEQEGVRISAEQIAMLTEVPGVAGVTVMTPGDSDTIVAAIEAAGIRPDARD